LRGFPLKQVSLRRPKSGLWLAGTGKLAVLIFRLAVFDSNWRRPQFVSPERDRIAND
jgi:hypothetical protein